MILPQARHGSVAAIATLVAILAGVTWFVDPARHVASFVAVVTMAGIWGVVAALAGTPWHRSRTESQQRFLTFAAVLGGAMLAASLAIKLFVASGDVGLATAERFAGIALGVMLAAFANRLPKMMADAGSDRRSSARAQAINRFVGWCFVVVGLATIGLWAFADIDRAADLSQVACAAAVVLVIARGAGTCVSSRRDLP